MAAYKYEHPTVAARIRRTLATATGPVSTRNLAETVGVTPPYAARVLRRLEDRGIVVRQLGAGGCYSWTARR